MDEFLEKVKKRVKKEWYATLKNFGIKVQPKEEPTMMTETYKTYEINLVPAIKHQMIRSMKFRNFMLFVCIVVSSVAIGVVAVLGSVVGGQSIALGGQDERLATMSSKLNNYDSLSEFLTIQSQLSGLNEIDANKKVLSRVFSILSTILPEAPDEITLSELSIDLTSNTLVFDAQADAKVEPYIDYRVLESFKKGFSLMKYDYGRYVDANGENIPVRCIVETDQFGNMLSEDGNMYVYWLKGGKGCDPGRDDYSEEEEVEEEASESSIMDVIGGSLIDTSAEDFAKEAEAQAAFQTAYAAANDYEKYLLTTELLNGGELKNAEVVKIYRTPQFSKWYNAGYMTLDGQIDEVPHFDSQCIVYTGVEIDNKTRWTSENSCDLAAEDPVIQDSSNGRNSEERLVLRFNATLTLDENVFKFENKHVMAISPTGKNVTDSYRQIEGMFAERAADCSDIDVVCTTNTENIGE